MVKPRTVNDAIRRFGLALLWVVTAGFMIASAVRDPYNPELQDTKRYGHNGEGALVEGLVVTLVELAVLYLILRPWNRSGSPTLRAIGALVLLVPWTAFSLFLCMHTGGIIAIHFLWLAVVDFILALVVFYGAGAWVGRWTSKT